MTTLHAAIVMALGACLLALVLRYIMRGCLRITHALLWVLVALAFVASPLTYALLGFAHTRWQWPTPTSMLFLLALAFVITLLFYQTIALSRAWRERKKLTQQLALLENRLIELEQSVRKPL